MTAEGFRLQLSSSVGSDLAHSITDAANALPKRGLEICGLLLGERTADGCVVTSLVPLNCRYSEGPCFRASAEELRGALPLTGVVGFYRSRNDGSLDLDQQDRLLLDLLGRESVAVLVVRQQKNTAGEGRLLVWGDGGVTSAGEIFLTRKWMGIARPEPPAPKAAAVVDESTVPEPRPAEVRPVFPVAERRVDTVRMARNAGAAAVLLLLIFIGWRVWESPGLRTGERSSGAGAGLPPPLEIVPNPNPGEDANAMQSLKAWIRSSDNSRLREIAVRELVRIGREDPETLPLLGETAQRDRSEIVRGAALEAIARGWRVNAANRSFFEERAQRDESAAVRKIAARELANAGEIRPRQSKAALIEEEVALRPADEAPVRQAPTGRLFRPPWAQATPAQAPVLPVPAPVAVGETATKLPAASAPPPGRGDRPASRFRPPGVVAFTPPSVLEQNKAVSIPRGLRRRLTRETVITLRVAVDSTGRVAHIYPPGPAGIEELAVWDFYAGKVRDWVFKPARRNAEAIPGETTLRFQITPDVR